MRFSVTSETMSIINEIHKFSALTHLTEEHIDILNTLASKLQQSCFISLRVLKLTQDTKQIRSFVEKASSGDDKQPEE